MEILFAGILTNVFLEPLCNTISSMLANSLIVLLVWSESKKWVNFFLFSQGKQIEYYVHFQKNGLQNVQNNSHRWQFPRAYFVWQFSPCLKWHDITNVLHNRFHPVNGFR